MAEILVVKTDKLFPNGIKEGFKEANPNEILDLINKYGEYRPRSEMEEDDSFQQIIPQIILQVEDKFFIHRIPQTGSESRLHDLWPILLGGHVEKSDLSIEAASEREFEEEINYKGKILKKVFLGIVKLHDNPVNKVHTGLVWLFIGDTEDFEPTEDHGLADGQFMTLGEIEKYKDKMTYWSREVYKYLLNK